MKIYVYLVLLLLIIISGCQPREKKESDSKLIIQKVDYYDNGQVKRVQEFYNDTIRYGIYKEYYDNGIIMYEVLYIDGKREGVLNKYYRSGELLNKYNYENGIDEGRYLEYYKSGILKKDIQSIHGEKFGESYIYSEDGKIEYYVYNIHDKSRYFCEYNKKGEIVYEEGNVFPCIGLNHDTIQLGQEFAAKICFINPPFYCSKLYIGDKFNKKGELVEERFIQSKPTTYIYKYTPTKKGVYKFGVKLKLTDIRKSETVTYGVAVLVVVE